MTESFDVFLSHNSKDKPAVRELAEALRARGLKVWLDEWELIPGRPWQEALEEIIETTRTSAVLVGKDGLGPWQDAEMRGCLSEFVNRKLPVIPVLLPGAPEAPNLPLFLKRYTWVDLRGGLTEEGINRLQWGVTGKPLTAREPLDGAEQENQDAFDPGTSAGLFVGISSFEDERIHGVPYAVDDAVDLAHLFTLELRLISPERTVLLLAGDPQKPESSERLAQLVSQGARHRTARMPDIYRYLGELTRGTEERGLFVLTVATHGVSDQGGDYLVATDSLRERTLRTGVAVAEVFDEVARAGAGRRLVLLDACRERLSSGTRGEGKLAMTQSFADLIAHSKGSVVLSGATLGGFAYDDVARKNGVFTAAILDGLRGEASAGPEGWITVRTLADFVQQRVTQWVRRNRPDDAAKSLGIGRRVEANAENLPLAPHPEAMREQQRYRGRREFALTRVRKNLGRVLSGTHWDQVATLLDASPSAEVKQLLEEIESLDGSERSQRSLRDFLRELSNGTNLLPPREEEKWEGEERAAPTELPMRQLEIQPWNDPPPRQWGHPQRGWWDRYKLAIGMAAIIVVIVFVILYLFSQGGPEQAPSLTEQELSSISRGYARFNDNSGIIVLVDVIPGQPQRLSIKPDLGTSRAHLLNPYRSLESWSALASTDANFEELDIYGYRIFASLLSAVSIDDLTDRVELDLAKDKVFRHKEIVFLCHGMGGLIIANMLNRDPAYTARVRLVYFASTPTTGSEILSLSRLLGEKLSSSPDFQKSSYSILRSWRAGDIPSYCVYEARPTQGVQITSMSNYSNLCDQPAKSINADYFEIFKPKSKDDSSYVTFKDVLLEVLP